MSVPVIAPAEAKLLGHYESIAALTDRMARAAQSGDWQTASALGEQYCHAVTTLCRSTGTHQPLTARARQHKHALMLRILVNDAAARASAAPALTRLGSLLGSLPCPPAQPLACSRCAARTARSP